MSRELTETNIMFEPIIAWVIVMGDATERPYVYACPVFLPGQALTGIELSHQIIGVVAALPGSRRVEFIPPEDGFLPDSVSILGFDIPGQSIISDREWLEQAQGRYVAWIAKSEAATPRQNASQMREIG